MDCFTRRKRKKVVAVAVVAHPKKWWKQRPQKRSIAGVKVLGSGCAKCHALEDATRAALAELHMETTIDHVTDFSQIATYGVMTTPALVVDDKVVSYGKVLKKDEAKALIQKVRG